MDSYLIKYKNKIMGIYNDIDQATLFIKSCLSNHLMIDSADILVYRTNSCFCINTIKITLDNKLGNDSQTVEEKKEVSKVIKKEIDHTDPSYLKLAEDKINIQHKINMLKLQKERINESKKIYDNDLLLYKNFKQNLINGDFIIPELFKDKFEIFKKLENENRLDYDNFTKEYNHNNIYEDHFKLNSYDESFTSTSKKKEINEEFDIDL
jgi:hypothetical protein